MDNAMKLEEILAISGQPGLYRYVAQSKGGIIVESLLDGRRMPVQGSSRVSSLGDIAIFTLTEDKPLGDIFQSIYEKEGGKPVINPKSDNEALKKEFGRLVEDYDRDRVHVSDMKKLFAWYNLLLECGMTSFVSQEEEQAEAEEAKGAAEESTAAKETPKKAPTPAARKKSE